MKISINRILALVLALTLLPLSVFAAPVDISGQEISCYKNESHLTTELLTTNAQSASTKTGIRNYTYYGSDGSVQWTGTLTATFKYDGTSVTCIAAVCTVSITNQDWYTVSKNAAKIGNNAYSYLTMCIDYMGLPTREKAVSMIMSCSPTGVIS